MPFVNSERPHPHSHSSPSEMAPIYITPACLANYTVLASFQ